MPKQITKRRELKPIGYELFIGALSVLSIINSAPGAGGCIAKGGWSHIEVRLTTFFFLRARCVMAR